MLRIDYLGQQTTSGMSPSSSSHLPQNTSFCDRKSLKQTETLSKSHIESNSQCGFAA